jgi:recombinational DNA repair protein RecT
MANQNSIIAQINNVQPSLIADLDFVKERYIKNFNACQKEKVGDLMYHKNVLHFKQTIAANKQLEGCDKFSLYAVFATAAVNGYSLDPADNEVYIIPRGGKAYLERQAGSHVKRLIRTGQIQYCEQAKLVYEGDIFQVENGRIINHTECFKSDNIIAGYVRMVIDEAGLERYFIYRKSDFESWRKKSSNPTTIQKTSSNGSYLSKSLWDNETLGGTNPEPNFLRTKLIKHACKEKCWAIGNTPITVEQYSEFEVDAEEEMKGITSTVTERVQRVIEPVIQTPELVQNAENFSQPNVQAEAGVVVVDDEF